MKTPSLSVVVADDHPVVLHGIVDVLKSCTNIDVVGACYDGLSVLDATRKFSPDIAVLDIAMPGLNGLDVLATMAAEKLDTKVVFLTASITDEQIVSALAGGAKAILLKDAAPDDLLRCVHSVARGENWFPEELVNLALEREKSRMQSKDFGHILTARERQILVLVAEGLPNKSVASRLGLSVGTVKIHLHNIYEKLGVPNRTTLTAFVYDHRNELSL
jgi:DNA-binding NarL/FixJ family response regulator